MDNLHGAAAQHIGRADKHRVSDAVGHADAGFDVCDSLALGLRNGKPLHGLFKAVAVFGALNGLDTGADDGHAQFVQAVGQVDGRLAAQRDDDAVGLFQLDDVHDVLNAQRLKVQLVRNRVVRRHGLGVVVDDNGLVPRLADGPDGVNRRVVKLNALADADGSGAQHDDLFAVRDHRLILLLVGRIEVRHIRVKFAGAGINHFIDRQNAVVAAQHKDLVRLHTPQPADGRVGKAHALGAVQQLGVTRNGSLELFFHAHDIANLVDEEKVDFGLFADENRVNAAAQQLCNGVNALVSRVGNALQHVLDRHVVKLFHVHMVDAGLERADRLEQALFHGAADGHDLARGLHLGGQLFGRGVELVKREARHFGDNVVERRLKAGRRVGQTDLVKRQAHGDERGHARNGIAARLGCQCR